MSIVKVVIDSNDSTEILNSSKLEVLLRDCKKLCDSGSQSVVQDEQLAFVVMGSDEVTEYLDKMTVE